MTEKNWEFDCDLNLNLKIVRKMTITDHFQIKRSDLQVEDVVQIVNQINDKIIIPTDYKGIRKVFRIKIKYLKKNYRLIFWFKNGTVDHLWIRNCYRTD